MYLTPIVLSFLHISLYQVFTAPSQCGYYSKTHFYTKREAETLKSDGDDSHFMSDTAKSQAEADDFRGCEFDHYTHCRS